MSTKGSIKPPWSPSIVHRPRPLNLGLCFLSSKVASDAPFLSCLRTCTDLSTICCTFYHTLGLKSKFQPNRSNRLPTKVLSDATYEGKIQTPKFKVRRLILHMCTSRQTRHPNSMPCLEGLVKGEQFLEVSKMQIPETCGTGGTPTSNKSS